MRSPNEFAKEYFQSIKEAAGDCFNKENNTFKISAEALESLIYRSIIDYFKLLYEHQDVVEIEKGIEEADAGLFASESEVNRIFSKYGKSE